jgi:hypothetical protein
LFRRNSWPADGAACLQAYGLSLTEGRRPQGPERGGWGFFWLHAIHPENHKSLAKYAQKTAFSLLTFTPPTPRFLPFLARVVPIWYLGLPPGTNQVPSAMEWLRCWQEPN